MLTDRSFVEHNLFWIMHNYIIPIAGTVQCADSIKTKRPHISARPLELIDVELLLRVLQSENRLFGRQAHVGRIVRARNCSELIIIRGFERERFLRLAPLRV